MNNIPNNNRSNILDLPNEILFIIFKKLNIGHVAYLLIDERFAQIALDPIYIRNLNMTVITRKSFFDYTFSIDDQVLTRICDKILPHIHSYVNKLTIEQDSLERILRTGSYPQLYSLSLINFEEKVLVQYLTGHPILQNLLTKQITHLNIHMQNKTISQWSSISLDIFPLILSMTKRLICLNICPLFSNRKMWISLFNLSPTSCMSSSLIELKINVTTFDDCLYLLDGRLSSLSKLVINVKEMYDAKANINNTKILPKLKYFSLTLNAYEEDYDERIIPLLRRMINLEELILFLPVIRVDSTYIDGIQLNDDILIYMPRLNKFTFSISTFAIIERIEINFSSNEDIQKSFDGKRYGQVGSYVSVDPMGDVGRSHVYSLPYQFENFFYLNNSFHFQNGMFDKVRCLLMDDTRPFERQVFKLISLNFPFLNKLTIYNTEPQKNKQHSSTLITFPHLLLLDLFATHVDYAEQFLLDKNIHLPCLLDLCITYESLAILTNNFTNDATHLNCTQLKNIHVNDAFVRPRALHEYSPLLSTFYYSQCFQ